jgi:hypothetical protein
MHGSFENLWNSAAPSDRAFDAAMLTRLPQGAGRYLKHAIAVGTPLASAVRLRMHGQIKLKRWYPFSAEQVICWSRGFIWAAVVRMRGMQIRGSDSFVDGRGSMRWKLFGILPIISASGPDVTRSPAGRINSESIWLPSVLCDQSVLWAESDASHARVRFTAHSETAKIDCLIDENGKLKAVSMPRWGNPEGTAFHCVNFGGFAEKERTFGGYTIPTQLRVGWHFGSDKFESEGEFFRVTIDDASYR